MGFPNMGSWDRVPAEFFSFSSCVFPGPIFIFLFVFCLMCFFMDFISFSIHVHFSKYTL